MSIEERFEDKIELIPFSTCHWWMGAGQNYGQFSLNGHTQRAHRVAYELYVSPIPEGLFVLHKCDNRTCVNPDHLFLGTQAVNVRDRDSKGRQAMGEQNGRARLTESQVLDIRELAGYISNSDLGRMFGVPRTTVCSIVHRKSWRYV